MTPAQRVLLRRLNEGPDLWQDGTPMTFREELRNEEAGLGHSWPLVKMHVPSNDAEDFGREVQGGWLDILQQLSIPYSESRSTP